MSIALRGNKTITAWAAAALLLIVPGATKTAAAHPRAHSAANWQDPNQDAQDSEQDRQDQEQEKRDREQERRDREQEKRDREQEARDRAQEKIERQEELYDDGREALDDDKFERAADRFSQLADLNGPQTDAALYWKAYAENKLAQKGTALATIADFKKRFPQSRWAKDVGALEIEVKQSTGTPANPDNETEDLKMLALQSLMNSNPQQAMPILEQVLNGPNSPKLKSKALFVLAQNGSPQSRDILARIAKGQGNPDLQRKAVQYLGLFGGQESKQVLAEVYASTTDESIKREILKAYMIGGDREHLFAAAKSEKDPALRQDAIRQLGLVHAPDQLHQLYQAETSSDVKKSILQAFFLSGDAKFLAEVAQTDKDPEIRRSAIHNLGLIGNEDARQALLNIYSKETDHENKETVLNSLFIQGNAHALVTIARSEKDPELKRTAVSKLALMNSKEGNEYLMELLQK
jgi:hypothetical protein